MTPPAMPRIGKRAAKAKPVFHLLPGGRAEALPGQHLAFTLPIRLVTLGNAKEHWRTKASRARSQRDVTAMVLRGLGAPPVPGGLTVEMTRIAPCGLDDDNASGSCKHVRDQIAQWLGVDDGRDGPVTWVVRQDRGPARTYGVRVAFRYVTNADRIAELEAALAAARRVG